MKEFIRWLFVLPLLWASRAWCWIQRKTYPHLPESRKQDFSLPQLELLPYISDPSLWNSDQYKTAFHFLETRGVHLTPNHFYSPIPDTTQIRDLHETELVGVDLNEAAQYDLLCRAFPAFAQEYNVFPWEKEPGLPPYAFHFNNGIFDGLDALVLYCMIRHFKPHRIVEVGSGWSTRLSAHAAILNGNTELISIEPYPDPVLRGEFPGLSTLIEKKVEEVEISFFQELHAGDVLFIDTSHVVKTGGDVIYLFLEVLPRLQTGVIVQIHDIFLPHDYPAWWIKDQLLFWNEQYLLQAFLTFNDKFQVSFANRFMQHKYPDKLKEIFPRCPFLNTGQSFWMQRVA